MTTPEFVLVHGGGHGAWCWFKLVPILEKSGYKTTVLDLISSGIDNAIADTIATIEEYAAPLIEYVSKASGQVILVGHSLGGIVISYVMEKYPDKVAKAIFVAAFMPRNNQSVIDVVPPEYFPTKMAKGCVREIFLDGPDAPSTSLYFPSTWDNICNFMYNACTEEVRHLAKSLIRPMPMVALRETLKLSNEGYGSCCRFYIMASKDYLIDESVQQSMVDNNPPHMVFHLEQSDHFPFLSFPNELAALFYHISSL